MDDAEETRPAERNENGVWLHDLCEDFSQWIWEIDPPSVPSISQQAAELVMSELIKSADFDYSMEALDRGAFEIEFTAFDSTLLLSGPFLPIIDSWISANISRYGEHNGSVDDEVGHAHADIILAALEEAARRIRAVLRKPEDTSGIILTWVCRKCGWANDNNPGPCRKCGAAASTGT